MQVLTRQWIWLIPLLLVTMALGARGLNADVIWGDEYHSISDAGGAPFKPLNPVQIWQGIAEHNPWHTPGYFFLLNGWGRLVGWSAAALRAMSLLFGLLAVAWTYRLGRDCVSPTVGLIAAVVLGTSASFIYYLHEIRMYVLFVTLASFELWVYLRIMRGRRDPDRLAWAALFVGALSMLYMHYFAVLPLLAVGVYHLTQAFRRIDGRLALRPTARWWRVTAVMAAAGVLFLPWVSVLVAVTRNVTRPQNVRENTLNALQATDAVLTLFGNGSLALAALTALLALWRPSRRARRVILLTLAAFGFALAINVWLRVVYYDARVRYLFALWPLLALVTAVGIARLGQRGPLRRLAPLLLALWVISGVWNAVDWARMAHFLEGSDLDFPMNLVALDLKTRAMPGDTVISYLPDDMPAWRYGGISDYYYRALGLDFRTVERKWQPGDEEDEQGDVIMSLNGDLRVWLASNTAPPPFALDDFKMSLTRSDYALCETYDDPQARIALALYTRAAVCCGGDQTPAAVRIDYGNGIALSGIEPLPETVTDSLPVILAWSIGPNVPLNRYSVALHVLGSRGEMVAQRDDGLTVQPFACEEKRLNVADLPDGDFRLTMVVYAWETGDRLTGAVTATGERGDDLPLGTFTVRR